LSLALPILETEASDPLTVLIQKVVPSFSAEASRSGWDPRVGGFAAHNMHILLPKTHPVWFRFSEAANGQIEKRAIFTFFQKVKKIDFYKSQKLIDLSNAEISWAQFKSYRHITKMHCSHLEI